jgi:hypothetical protein
MFRLINPLAATLLVVGTAVGFTAHAALSDESAPTEQVDHIVDDSTPGTPAPTFHRPRPGHGHNYAQ